MTVKANQSALLDAVTDRISEHAPAPTRRRSSGHGRTSEHLITVAPATGIDFPGAVQVFRIVRYTGALDGQRASKEVAYGITNLSDEQADAAALAVLVREHWSIENSIHWVRDVTCREDASTVRTGNAPLILAARLGVVVEVFQGGGGG